MLQKYLPEGLEMAIFLASNHPLEVSWGIHI
jgi:hypothetical protein